MVLEVGTRNGEECQWTASRATYAVASNTIGANNTSHLSLPLSASTYCARLLDDGFLAEDLAYTIVVVHP
jgi:hypothetical protein